MNDLRLFPTYLLYLSTFGLASLSKLTSWSAPEWFEKQFAGTALNLFPGALSLQFHLIGLLEGAVCLGLLGSLARGEFRQGASARTWLLRSLWLAEGVFAILGFGQRLSGDFHGAAELFVYFGVTLVVARYVRPEAGPVSACSLPA